MGVRRNTITYDDAWIVLGVAVVAGVLGAVAGAAPTGQPVVDAVLTAAFAGVLTWLGASVPWWALITVSGVAGVFAGAGGQVALIVVAWAALGASLWIAGARANRPYLRAAVVGAVVQVVLRFDWDPFFSSSALVAAVIAGIITFTGVRRRQRFVRRRVYWTGASLVVFAVAATAAFGIAFAQVRTEASRGYGLMLDGMEFVEAGQTARGASILRDAAEDLGAAGDGLAGVLAQPVRLVPGAAQNRNVPADVFTRAAEAATAAADTLDRVDIDQLRVSDGRVDLAAFDLLEPPLTDLETTVVELREALQEARSDWLLPPLRDRFDRAEARAAHVERQAVGTAMLARLGPGMLGGDGPRRYFIAFVNPAEARATGGLMGNWSEITIDGGRIEQTANGRTAELQSGVRDNDVALDVNDAFVLRYQPWVFGSDTSTADPNAWVNAPISPDLPTVASVYAQLYEGATGRAVDGVLVIDPAGLAAMLDVTGPVEIDDPPLTLSSANAERFLVREQYEFEEAEREDLLEAVSSATVDRLLNTTLPAPHDMAAALADAALEGHLGVWAQRPAEQEMFTFVGIDGAIPDWGVNVQTDVLAVTVNNASGNKIESFLERSIEYRPVHDADSGEVRAELVIRLHNTAPATGFPDYVIGNILDLPTGTNRLLLEVFSPLTIGDLSIDGVPQYTFPSREAGMNVALTPVDIPPGGTVEVTATMEGRVAPGWYELVYRPQALPLGDELVVDGRSDGRSIRFDGPIARRSIIDATGVRAWR